MNQRTFVGDWLKGDVPAPVFYGIFRATGNIFPDVSPGPGLPAGRLLSHGHVTVHDKL